MGNIRICRFLSEAFSVIGRSNVALGFVISSLRFANFLLYLILWEISEYVDFLVKHFCYWTPELVRDTVLQPEQECNTRNRFSLFPD